MISNQPSVKPTIKHPSAIALHSFRPDGGLRHRRFHSETHELPVGLVSLGVQTTNILKFSLLMLTGLIYYL